MPADIIPFPSHSGHAPARTEPQSAATFFADSESAAWELVDGLRRGPYPMPDWVILVTLPRWPSDRFIVTVH